MFVLPKFSLKNFSVNTVDERDEMCTAQSRPGNPEYLGIDDYPCEGYQLHYALCMWVPTPRK